MTTIPPTPSTRHRCQPPERLPRDQWRTVQPPRSWMKPEDAARAKPMPIPTDHPRGTLWQCPTCSRWWVRDVHDGCAPPTYYWRRVPWYRNDLRRRITRELATPAGQASLDELGQRNVLVPTIIAALLMVAAIALLLWLLPMLPWVTP